MKKNKTIIIFAVSIITAILAFIVLLFFINIIKNKNKHTSAIIQTLELKMIDKKNAEVLNEKILEVESTHKNINDYFVSPEKIDIFVEYLENLGEDFNTVILIRNVEMIKNNKNEMKIKISISGSFNDVLKSIHALENIPYQVKIDNIYLNKDINPEEENQIINRWQADVGFNILISQK